MIHRKNAYDRLSGKGIEIGAFAEPAELPAHCEVKYFDVVDRAAAAALFPEVDANLLVDVNIVGNLDKRDLRKLGDGVQDFVISNHVIEHLANPIGLVEDMLFITRPGGKICLSAPDKNYTFDRTRDLTTFDHLLSEYRANVEEVTDEHYMDFLKHVGPHVFEEPGRNIDHDIACCRRRREHAHVWTSDSFIRFLEECRRVLGFEFTILETAMGDETNLECFVLMERS